MSSLVVGVFQVVLRCWRCFGFFFGGGGGRGGGVCLRGLEVEVCVWECCYWRHVFRRLI